MKKKRSSRLYLKDILDSIQSIREYTSGLTSKEFRSKKMAIDAVVRNFEIIGEAAKNIPKELKSLHHEIPWKEMAGMRNKTIHEYFGVDLGIIWKTVQSLSELEKLFEKIYYEKDKREGKINK